MRVDRRLESHRVVGPVTFHAERPHVHPLLHRRQRRNVGGQGAAGPGALSMPKLHAPLTPVGADLYSDRQVFLNIRMGTAFHGIRPTRASLTLNELKHIPAHDIV